MKKEVRRQTACLLSLALTVAVITPWTFPKDVLAEGQIVAAGSGDWHYYCIDGNGYATNGVCSRGDRYTRVSTKAETEAGERPVIFWALLSFLSAYEQEEEAAAAVAAINRKAEAAGLRRIDRAVTEADLKGVLHSAEVRRKYDWLDFVVDHEEEYLRLAGLLRGSSRTKGGQEIPFLLRDAVSLSEAVAGIAQDGGFVLEFDPSGNDGDFLAKVPLKLSADGENWQEGTINGWNAEKSRTGIRFTNPDPEAGPLYLKFDPEGTEYESAAGGYGSPDNCYTDSIEVWKCVQCYGTHVTGDLFHPLEDHQRNVRLELKTVPAAWYGIIGGRQAKAAGAKTGGSLEFQIYRHEEDMKADYRVQLYKYDHETGNPLEGAVFDLYERFDDREQVNRERDGPVQIYEGGGDYAGGITHSPVWWDGFRRAASVRTDRDGHGEYRFEKGYHYDKTFCDGHPAPVFVQVPEEEIDDETGEVINEPEILEARAVNGELAAKWLGCEADCREKAEGDRRGVHFHWLMEEVDYDEIRAAAETGDCVQAGPAESAQPEEAYERSGCRQDCEETYAVFISMRYSYTFAETAAREGYILHGGHKDHIPIEIITTDSSQNGANSVFGGGYSESVTGCFATAAADPAKPQQEKAEPEKGLETVTYYTQQIHSMKMDGTVREPVLAGLRETFQATESDGDRASVGTPSTPSKAGRNRSFLFSVAKSRARTMSRQGEAGPWRGREDSGLFSKAYQEALWSAGCGEENKPGPTDRYSHSSGMDGEEEAFRIYDHRTEGEIHIRKQDMELSPGETQGDAVLEGAVYGLFAAQDLVHPDGTTGIVFRQNDLAAVACTDKEGEASFMAITEAPGHTYDYGAGKIVERKDGWNGQFPENLYTRNHEEDDYRGDHRYTRSYADLTGANGNCWIGRPLFLGNYYIKELSRSEGYELSVNGRGDQVSNYGYSLDVSVPRGQGSAALTTAPYVEPQSLGQEEDTMANVINFVVTSRGTAEKGYDMILSRFPQGTKLYRKDCSSENTEFLAGTGQMEKRYLYDALGQPVYQTADRDDAYPKLNPDGSFMTEEAAVSRTVTSMGRASIQSICEETAEEILNEEPGQRENGKRLDLKGEKSRQFLYIKMKVEAILRANGYQTPKKTVQGKSRYSDMTEGIYDRGVRQGYPDPEGLSGTEPGEPALRTVYGYPVVKTELPEKTKDGRELTAADAILSLVDFYCENPWYSFGGIDGYEETDGGWVFSLYAGVAGNPENYIVLMGSEEESMICHRLPWIPDDPGKSPRWAYVTYSNMPEDHGFGTWENFSSWQILGMYRCSAVLVSDGVVEGDGTVRSRTVKRNVYYKKGEILRDKNGNALQAFEWVEKKLPVSQSREIDTWTPVAVEQKDGALIAHGQGSYTDAYGVFHSDRETGRETVYKLVLPRKEVILGQEELKLLPPGSGFREGDRMGAGDYALRALKAGVMVCLDYEDQRLSGDGLYVRPVSLAYPGQEFYFQDGDKRPGEGTRNHPITVEERIIRQPVRIDKSVRDKEGGERALDGFRFKIYLKSNLQRLYRDPEGKIVWVDRKGREVDPGSVRRSFPAAVVRYDTKVPHKTDPLYKDHLNSVQADPVLYKTEKGLIADNPSSGYTRLLETENGVLNYEKFFDAIYTANRDKWDGPGPGFTSHRPLGNRVNRCREAEENAEASDNVRQFAINWYLEQEVRKLTREAGETEALAAYSDQIYDRALRQAIEKSRNYLRPFFEYDLDRLYAVPWDSEKGGGKDKDTRTLSADTEEGGSCYGISGYLPYGTYVVVEQQPLEFMEGDLANREYDTDRPKEILIPSVYEEDSRPSGQKSMNSFYRYRREESPEDQAARFLIRFREEDHVIRAHNYHGDFEIYKYGLDLDRITNGAAVAGEGAGTGDYFALSQSLYRPYHNYYNPEDDRTGGEVSYYLTEGMDGREGISRIYRYSSVSEQGRGQTMTGASTAIHGKYSHALVPWTMAIPENGRKRDREGAAEVSFMDFPYKNRLRIEKLDSETHENLLHDGAIFRIYRAERDNPPHGTGRAAVYEKETPVTGTRTFLEAMGAEFIREADGDNRDGLCTGLAPAGTPMYREEDQVIMTDDKGKRTGDFKAFTTVRDGLMEKTEHQGSGYGQQTTGYLETPETLAAGVYVLAEVKPPAGYVRTRPIAVEIYSDGTAYYKEGSGGVRILAALYGKFRDKNPAARIYVENTPIKVRIEKKKKKHESLTYKIDGRTDGSLVQIGGDPGCEYAYSGGEYLGYRWKKGTLEYLQERKEAGDQVEMVFHDGVFAGYGYITVAAEEEKDENPYVPGAQMTLYEGIRLKTSGDTEDHRYKGLVVRRSTAGNVTGMYVEKGYGGTRTEFCRRYGEDGRSYWDGVEAERPDTDILWYDLGDLDIFADRYIEGKKIPYGYNRDHGLVNLEQLENDRRTMAGPDREFSIFAFKGGRPYLELAGGDFTEAQYSEKDKVLTVPPGMTVWHLDRDGTRDSLADPHTGMAYVPGENEGEVYVWPVKLTRDRDGRITAADKISTSRPATIGENREPGAQGQEEGFLTGTWQPADGAGSHKMASAVRNFRGDSQDGEPLIHENPGSFTKSMLPVLNVLGLPVYYRRSEGTYEKNILLYDRDGDLVRRKDSDLTGDFGRASYLAETGDPQTSVLYHRQGESYMVENTWITGEQAPNDPFDNSMTDGRADLLKRVPAGVYIMEEIKAPPGYIKGFPKGVTVEETGEIRTSEMEDDRTRVLFRKIDGSDTYEYEILDMGLRDSRGRPETVGTKEEGKGSFGHGQVPGARLVLCDETGRRAVGWTTAEEPMYLEGLPEGNYVLKEEGTPKGFITCAPVTVKIRGSGQVQVVDLFNDHTKVEFEKYSLEGEERVPVKGAGFALYEAMTDERGQVVWRDGQPVCDRDRLMAVWETGDGKIYEEFTQAFEQMYRDYGTGGRSLAWVTDGKEHRADYVSHSQIEGLLGDPAFPASAEMFFLADGGQTIRILVYEQHDNRQGRDFTYEYQFDYKKLPDISPCAVSYETQDRVRRLDYLPPGKEYVLVETRPPAGYGKAEDRLIKVEDTAQIQRHRILNQESSILISKCGQTREGDRVRELPGAVMVLYRAGAEGEFIRDQEHLAARWVSGQDGVYTETDRINGRIPEGYEKGDLKPHRLTRLPDGIYYLAEQKSPDYYTLMEPIKLVFSQKEQTRIVRAANRPAEGELEILKKDGQGDLLEGALFRLTACRDPEGEQPVFTRDLSGHQGRTLARNLPVGETAPDGSVKPYWYRIQEITPPEGYESDRQVHVFRFPPDDQGKSWNCGQRARVRLEITDRKTRVVIGKRNFEHPGQWVAGAEMAVYKTEGRDETGQYVTGEEPEMTWVTGKEETRVLEGLTAGQTYVLTEKKAPEGYEKMEPVVFTLSSDGRKISAVTGQTGRIRACVCEECDQIHCLELQGRYGVKVEMILKDQKGQTLAVWTAGGDGHDLGETEGIRDGEVCCLTEITVYSDGSREVTGYTTRTVHLSDEGVWRVPDRTVRRVHTELTRSDGKLIREWNPSELLPSVDAGIRRHGTSVFQKETEYCLAETTIYSDKSVRDSGKFGFLIDEYGSVSGLLAMDRKQKTQVSKLESKGQIQLEGALMQVLREDRSLVEQWISGKEPHVLEAVLDPEKTYILREEAAPMGYSYANEIWFKAAGGEYVSQVVMEDKETKVVLSKKGSEGEELPGALLQVLDLSGNVAEQWISGTEPYEIRGKLQAGAAYIFHEEKPPPGYAYGEDVKFTVSVDGSTDRTELSNIPTRVEVSKRDMAEDRELEGAVLQVLDRSGNVVEEWISETEPHTITGKLQAGAAYYLHEKTPPQGYQCAEDLEFTVSRDGKTDVVVMRDRALETEVPPGTRKRKTPPRTQIPEQTVKKKTGKVYGEYQKELPDQRVPVSRAFTNLGLPETGHKGVHLGLVICMAAGLSAAIWALLRRFGKRKKGKRAAFLCLCLVMTVFMAGTAWADRVEVKPDGKILVTGEICLTEDGSPDPLAEIYEYKTIEYRQQSCQIVEVMTEPETREVEKEIVYEEVEQTDVLPETLSVTVKDERYGRQTEKEFPVLDVEFYNWRWTEGFEFPLLVEEADAEVYELGGNLVPAREERPFEGYEDEVLRLISVDPEYYRVTAVDWLGESWLGEDQKIYRRALAEGEKYVADCKVIYGGTAVLEPVKGLAWQAVYEQVREETEEETEERGRTTQETEPADHEPADPTEEEEEQQGAEEHRWYQTIMGRVMISIGILFLLIPAAAAIIRRKEKRRKAFPK